jgi:anti-sigma B factor antagonist
MAPLESNAPLRVDTSGGPDRPRVRLTGELDLSNVATAQAAIEPLLESRPATLEFDLAALSFMDSSGITLFIRAATRVGAVILIEPSEVVRQIVAATGLSELLRIAP